MDEPGIVVAGAGALGSAIAQALARAGHSVTLADGAAPGANASGVAAGMLAPAFESLFDETAHGEFEFLRRGRDLWPALADEIGLPLARDGAMAIGARTQAQQWAALLSARGARARVERLDDRWAVFTPEDWRLEPRAALEALARDAERWGARRVSARVVGFERGVVGFDAAPATAARILVLATGADAVLRDLAPELDALSPIKGHILRAEGRFAAGPVLRAPGVYLCRGASELVLGATMEAGRADAGVDEAVASRLLAQAEPLLAGLEGVTWRASAGVRAASPDGLPMVGAGRAPGVILALGARRNGWLLAPLIAAVVRDLVEGRPGDAIARRFDPARFAIPR
jgi:glycine oxidase